jgi:hypothetical protein
MVLAGCTVPEMLHPVSAGFLDLFLTGELPRALFQRFFSLPNSDYIELGACIARNIGATAGL